jgi:hypothetical protein
MVNRFGEISRLLSVEKLIVGSSDLVYLNNFLMGDHVAVRELVDASCVE